MRIWGLSIALAVAAAACSKHAPDPCEQAYAKLIGIGAMGGQGYGQDALLFGAACADLGKDDFACIEKATSERDLTACDHARSVIEARSMAMQVDRGAPTADPAVIKAMGETADAICGCKDAACMVGVGQRERAAIDRIVKNPPAPDDPDAKAAGDRIGKCTAAVDAHERAARAGSAAARAGGGASALEKRYEASKAKVARIGVRKLTFEAYPQWAAEHPSEKCPTQLSDLAQWMPSPQNATTDAWGNPYSMVCGDAAPPAAHGFGVVSPGPDGKPGTADDVTSWQ